MLAGYGVKVIEELATPDENGRITLQRVSAGSLKLRDAKSALRIAELLNDHAHNPKERSSFKAIAVAYVRIGMNEMVKMPLKDFDDEAKDIHETFMQIHEDLAR